MNIEEALTTAMELEVRARDAYVEAWDAAKHPRTRMLLDLLSDEEHAHLQFLEHELDQWSRTRGLSVNRTVVEPEVHKTVQRWAERAWEILDGVDFDEEIELLEGVLKIEETSNLFYQKLVENLPSEAKLFFENFLQAERGHMELVEAQLEAVRRDSSIPPALHRLQGDSDPSEN